MLVAPLSIRLEEFVQTQFELLHEITSQTPNLRVAPVFIERW
jgi:hypothetical protein